MSENRAPVVTLCGSMRFLEDFIRAERELTMEGYVVLGVSGFRMGSDNGLYEIDSDFKEKLEEAVLRKIDMSDEVFVINKDGYIGETTRKELQYAQEHGKVISFMFINCPNNCPTHSHFNECKIAKTHHSVTMFVSNNDCPMCIGYGDNTD